MAYRLYKRRMSHARREGATYLVTWCVQRGIPDLERHEREVVVEVLRHFHGVRYQLHAFAVMNDHVHVVVTPFDGLHFERLVGSWKERSARRINQMRSVAGRLWQGEYCDRILTGRRGLEDTVSYVINNPLRRWPHVVVYPWVWWWGMDEKP
jgi:REP element-mobilizing transposase RayT